VHLEDFMPVMDKAEWSIGQEVSIKDTNVRGPITHIQRGPSGEVERYKVDGRYWNPSFIQLPQKSRGEDEFSPEARAAALEARRRKGKWGGVQAYGTGKNFNYERSARRDPHQNEYKEELGREMARQLENLRSGR
jgi:hypothetical protein